MRLLLILLTILQSSPIFAEDIAALTLQEDLTPTNPIKLDHSNFTDVTQASNLLSATGTLQLRQPTPFLNNNRPTGIPPTLPHARIRRPYQIELYRLKVPPEMITRLEMYVASHHSQDSMDTLHNFSFATRVANIIASMVDSPEETLSKNDRVTVILSAILLNTDLNRAPGTRPALGAASRLLKDDPETMELLDQFEKLTGIKKGKIWDLLKHAEYSMASESREPRPDKNSNDYETLKSANERLWARRWGHRLVYAEHVALYSGGLNESIRSARRLANELNQEIQANNPTDDRLSEKDVLDAMATDHIRVISSPHFFLLNPSMRVKVAEARDLFPSKDKEDLDAAASPTGRIVSQDSSVELEIDGPNNFTPLLIPDPSKESREIMSDIYHKITGLNDMKPSNKTHFQILQSQSFPEYKKLVFENLRKYRNGSYDANRKIPHVTNRRWVLLKFNRETSFLGKIYSAGTHRIHLTRVLRTPPEYKSPEDIKAFQGVELHFRDNHSAGTVSSDARTFLRGLGIPNTHQHTHIVAQLPRYGPSDRLSAAQAVDLLRRTNLTAEMVDIIMERFPISTSRKFVWWTILFSPFLAILTPIIKKLSRINSAFYELKDIRFVDFLSRYYFGFLKSSQITSLSHWFRQALMGIPEPIKERFKLAWVAFRGPDKYDRRDLYGFEYRGISAESNPSVIREILDQVQRSMLTKDYGIPEQTMQEWINKYSTSGEDIDTAIGANFYHKPWSTLFKTAAPEVKKQLNWYQKIDLRSMGIGHEELKMLVHNWSDDPLVFENQVLRDRIASEQVRALKRLLKDNVTINDAVSDFLLDSGLFDTIAKSLGLTANF